MTMLNFISIQPKLVSQRVLVHSILMQVSSIDTSTIYSILTKYHSATSTCIACDDGEATCNASGAGGALTCKVNSAGKQTFFNSVTSECATNCPSGTFADTS